MRRKTRVTSPPIEPDPDQPSQLAYGLAQQKIDRQLSAGDALDSKITGTMAAAGSLLALFAAVAALRPDRIHGASAYSLIVVAVLFGLVVLASAIALFARHWGQGPAASEVRSFLIHGVSEDKMMWKATRTLIDGAARNERNLRVKSQCLAFCLVMMIAETGATALGLVVFSP
jgi:hypothetical protein